MQFDMAYQKCVKDLSKAYQSGAGHEKLFFPQFLYYQFMFTIARRCLSYPKQVYHHKCTHSFSRYGVTYLEILIWNMTDVQKYGCDNLRMLKKKPYNLICEKKVSNFQKSLPGGHQKSIVFIICEILKMKILNDFVVSGGGMVF